MTELAKFKEAYATMTVAVYEPLILKWVSAWTLRTVAGVVANRMARVKLINREALSTALAVSAAQSLSRTARLPTVDVLNRAAQSAGIATREDAAKMLSPVNDENRSAPTFPHASARLPNVLVSGEHQRLLVFDNVG